MSASLVGSEMCIRDSRNMGHLPMAEAPQSEADSLQRCPSEPSRSLEAVSYTHLTLPTICSV
eukprot:6535987-Alexandrium_andersonii.AAC.1